MSRVSKSGQRARRPARGSLGTSLREWQKRLGLQAWEIILTRKPEEAPTGYPGTEDSDQEGFNAGYCMCDPHALRARIFVAPDDELEANGLIPEMVLVHELLHLRLGPLVMVPMKEPVGHNLLLENAINALSRALVGTKVASTKRKGASYAKAG